LVVVIPGVCEKWWFLRAAFVAAVLPSDCVGLLVLCSFGHTALVLLLILLSALLLWDTRDTRPVHISPTLLLEAPISAMPREATSLSVRWALQALERLGRFSWSDPSTYSSLMWLVSSYGPGKTSGSLIYLHDMTDAGMRGTTPQNLEVFQRLAGRTTLEPSF